MAWVRTCTCVAGRGHVITFLVALLRTNYETGVNINVAVALKKTGGTSIKIIS